MIADYLKAIAALIVLIPCIFLSITLLKRFNRIVPNKCPGIKIINQLSIGIKERILVIEVEGVKMVVGVSPQAFNTLYILEHNEKST